MFDAMAGIIPEGISGHCKIEHFEVSEEDSRFTKMRAAAGHPNEYVPAGQYCRLRTGTILMMTDTPHEQRINQEVVRMAKGEVLIGGLGIGMVLIPILRKPEVRRVLIIEKYTEVADLVLPSIISHVPEASDKLRFEVADIFEWKPSRGRRWDTIYFDIWSSTCIDNLKEITKLRRKFSRRLNRNTPGAWMGAWEEGRLRYLKKRETY